MKACKIVVVSLSFALAVAASTRAAGPGGQLLEGSGVRGGVVVPLGCGDGQLTVGLSGGARFLVHGLDTDGARAEAASPSDRAAGRRA